MNSIKMQKTICKDINTCGLGLHSGRDIKVRLRPAPADSGIRFKRADLPEAPVLAASPENVSSTMLATTLGRDGNKISTVEHLMAALSALNIDNILVEADGPELPVFDGSAAKWMQLLKESGLAEQSAPKRQLMVTRPFSFSVGDKSISVRPASRFSVEAHIDFGGAIGRHCFYYVDSEDAFDKEISKSRTFCLLKDVEMMHNQGLALGGSLDNAVVVGDDGILNPEGLRYNDEFVRHKILDFIGDLAMAGAPVIGQFVINKPGHDLNRRFLSEAMTQPGLLKFVVSGEKSKRTTQKKSRRVLPGLPLQLAEAIPPLGI